MWFMIISLVYLIATLSWMAGVAVVLLCLFEVVPEQTKYVGLGLLLGGGVVAWIIRQRYSYPKGPNAYPVEPSMVWVNEDSHLEVGSRVLAKWKDAWWRAVVIAIEQGEFVTIHYLDWDEFWNESVPRTQLQVDTSFDPTRSYGEVH